MCHPIFDKWNFSNVVFKSFSFEVSHSDIESSNFKGMRIFHGENNHYNAKYTRTYTSSGSLKLIIIWTVDRLGTSFFTKSLGTNKMIGQVTPNNVGHW